MAPEEHVSQNHPQSANPQALPQPASWGVAGGRKNNRKMEMNDTAQVEAVVKEAPVPPRSPRPRAGGVTVCLARDEADISAMINLGRLLHAESHFRKHPYDETRLREFGRIGLSNGNPGLIVAERGGQMVGMAVVVMGEHFFSADKTATVQLLYVAPPARGGSAAPRGPASARWWAWRCAKACPSASAT